jgi:RNA polymerase sigma-70 factor (family 1)
MPADKNLYSKFEALFREHYNALANYAYSILKSEQDAEDVVQEVFIKIWQNNPDIVKSEQVKFYLITSIKNGCISFLRKQAGKKFVQPEDVQLHRAPDEEIIHQPEDLMEMANKALALLPPQCGVIFKMSRFGKLTYQQIADELGLSVKTVENQMGKALRMMRDFARQNKVTVSLLLFCISNF